MKKKLILLFAACLATFGLAGAQNLKIQGAWKMLERNGQKVPAHLSQIKLITPTHFMWTMSDNQGNIMNGAGGTYTLKGNKYAEMITLVLPGMKPYYNYQAEFELSVDGNRMTQKGYVRDWEITEIWERIEPATDAKGPNILGTWKVLAVGDAKTPSYYTNIKLITATHFMWLWADNQGNVINGAGGTYTLEGNTLTQTIDKVLPVMKEYYNNTEVSELSVDGNKMSSKGVNAKEVVITGAWERIK